LESSQEEDSGLAWRRRVRTQEWLRISQTLIIGTTGEEKVGAQTCNFYDLIMRGSKVTLLTKFVFSS
jgi:hypothetical protein